MTWITRLHQGWPFLFVMTVADVEPGTELVVSYGEQYWHLPKT
jgi:hypothetical protein